MSYDMGIGMQRSPAMWIVAHLKESFASKGLDSLSEVRKVTKRAPACAYVVRAAAARAKRKVVVVLVHVHFPSSRSQVCVAWHGAFSFARRLTVF